MQNSPKIQSNAIYAQACDEYSSPSLHARMLVRIGVGKLDLFELAFTFEGLHTFGGIDYQMDFGIFIAPNKQTKLKPFKLKAFTVNKFCMEYELDNFLEHPNAPSYRKL